MAKKYPVGQWFDAEGNPTTPLPDELLEAPPGERPPIRELRSFPIYRESGGGPELGTIIERGVDKNGNPYLKQAGPPEPYRKDVVGYEQREVEVDPETVHYTNIPDTAAQWRKEGRKTKFLAETPGDYASSKAAGYDTVKGEQLLRPQDEGVPKGPKPTEGQLSSFENFNKFWDVHVQNKWNGTNPVDVNPVEVGLKAEEEARKKYSMDLVLNAPNSIEYKNAQKMISQAKKDAVDRAQATVTAGKEERKMMFQLFEREEAKRAKASQQGREVVTPAATKTVLDESERIQSNLDSYIVDKDTWNAVQEGVAKGGKVDPKVMRAQLMGKKLKPDALTSLNTLRARSGMAPLVERPVKWKKDAEGKDVYYYHYVQQGSPGQKPSGGAGVMSEQDARKALTDKGVSGKDQEYWISEYRKAGKVK